MTGETPRGQTDRRDEAGGPPETGTASRRGSRWRFGLVVVAVGIMATLAILYFRSRTSGLTLEQPLTATGRTTRPVMLYFGDPSRPGLLPERREVLLDPAPEDRVRRIVNELLRGPNSPKMALFRDDCRVRSVFFETPETVVIDFRGSPFPDEASARACNLAVTALIRVVTGEFPVVEWLTLLVDGGALAESETRLALPAAIATRSWLGDGGDGRAP